MKHFIGREPELKELKKALDSDSSEFIAVYGRRRVGKTLLVRAAAEDRFAFFVTGLYERPKSEQLVNFAIALQRASGSEGLTISKNWPLAFYELAKHLESLPPGKKTVFMDELPWMDTPRSGFVSALDNFWNGWAALRDDIKLIVCGSSTSWMLDNIIHETGGLHKRLTGTMPVAPLTLGQTKHFLHGRGICWSDRQTAECYMVMGGIPYYLTLLDGSHSVAQNVDRLFFREGAPLRKEFGEIFQALYRKSEGHRKIMAAVAMRGAGVTRRELLEQTGMEDNGAFSKMLEEVEECGFIRAYEPFGNISGHDGGKAKASTLYQMVDPFSLFHFRFLKDGRCHGDNYWSAGYNSPEHSAWAGLAFEMLCLNHTRQILKALGISGMQTTVCSWRSPGKAQIDLLIDRRDDTVSVCEMKCCRDEFVFDAEEERKLTRRVEEFIRSTGTRKSIIVTLVTTFGLKRNAHSDVVQSVVTLENLMAD